MSDSSIHYGKDGHATAFVGPDAIQMYRAACASSAIGLWIKTKMIPTRGVTITKMLAIATEYTGKRYTPAKAQQAVDDLKIWVATMKAALPHVTKD